jgi:hypothetical protein
VTSPRRLAHRGTVVATGFVIDASLLGVAQARQRVLALWTPGAKIHLHDDGFVITGLHPNRIRVSVAPGTPIVEQHGVFATLPLDADEVAELAVPRSIVVAAGGVARPLPLERAREIDLATWIDLSEFQIVEVKPLASPPVRAAIPPPPISDIRSLTGAPPADADVKDVTAALARARAGGVPRAGAITASSRWRRFVEWLSVRLAPRQKALPAATGSGEAKPSWFDKLRSRLAAALWNSRLGTALGRRHAEYLRRVLEMFDRGQLDEALRHAIPIGGDGGDARLGLAAPRPRKNLSLTFGARRKGSVIPVADVAIGMMRDRYRAAAARLEQSGRIDDAAFVLAELLADVNAAIAVLERHQRYSVAARLAEGRGLEPGLVVRLWFLAGDRERAVDAARKYHAWAGAVARLEQSGDSRAAVLRMLWADHLADTGDFVQAIEAAWPVKPSRALVEAWIDRGIALEGTTAARLLVKKLVVAPTSFAEVAPAMLTVLGASGDDAVRQRVAMIDELVGSPSSAELQTIARPALRALLRDCGVGADDTRSELVDRLVKFANDAALRADRPAFPAARRRLSVLERSSFVDLQWSTHDAGALPVYDAAILPGDRLLLALGELGVRIVGRSGRTIAQIDQPATRLVVSDHGSRALAIATRGSVQRIARIDVIERRGAYWCDAEFDDSANTFDGDLWIAARGREVFAVDTIAARWRAVWGVQVDPASARCSIRRAGPWFAIEVRDGAALEHWHYDRFTLRARKPWVQTGTEYVAVPARPSDPTFVVRDPDDARVSEVAQIEAVALGGELAIVNRRAHTGLTVTCSHVTTHRALATFRLDGAEAATARLTDRLLTISDDRGRVIVFDIERGVLRRDLRTS